MLNLKTILAAIVATIIVACVLAPLVSEYTEDEGSTKTPQVIVISGQSNSEYLFGVNVDYVNSAFDAPSEEAYYWGTPEQPLTWGTRTQIDDCGLNPMYSGGLWKVGGYEAPLAHEITKRIGAPIVTVNLGVGGITIAEFLDGKYHEYITTVLDHALRDIEEEFTEYSFAGWIWIQGEAETTTTTGEYITQFGKVKDYFASNGFENCYLVQTGSITTDAIKEAQEACCEIYDKTTLASTKPLSISYLHYTQKTRCEIAEETCDYLIPDIEVTKKPMKGASKSALKIVPAMVIIAIMAGAIGTVALKRSD